MVKPSSCDTLKLNSVFKGYTGAFLFLLLWSFFSLVLSPSLAFSSSSLHFGGACLELIAHKTYLNSFKEGTDKELIQEVMTHSLGKTLGVGGQLEVYEIQGVSSQVIKRLKTGIKLYQQNNLSIKEYFELLKEQHHLILSYFGSDFIPRTRFLELDTNLETTSESSSRTSLYLSGKEFLMIQDRIFGEQLGNLEITNSPRVVSAQLKAKLREFIRRYREMQKHGVTIEDQIMIDFSTGRIWISDTNFPRRFSESLQQGQAFLDLYGVDQKAVATPQKLWNFLMDKVPEFQIYKDQTFVTYADQLHPVYGNKELFKKIENRITKENGESAYIGFIQLIYSLDRFPLEGDNRFIRNLSRIYQVYIE